MAAEREGGRTDLERALTAVFHSVVEGDGVEVGNDIICGVVVEDDVSTGRPVAGDVAKSQSLQQLLRPPEKRVFADTRRTVDMPSLGERLNSLRDGVILEVGIQ